MQAIPESNCVAVFTRHEDAENAIKKLKQADFDLKKLSILGRDYHTEEHAVGFSDEAQPARGLLAGLGATDVQVYAR